MDKDDPELMAERKKRIKRIGFLDARLRPYFSKLSAISRRTGATRFAMDRHALNQHFARPLAKAANEKKLS